MPDFPHHQGQQAHVAGGVTGEGPPLAGTFLAPAQVRQIQAHFGTPVYVYDLATLVGQARSALAMPNAFGLTVRYAMKAWSNAAVLRLFDRLGLHFDASSGYEVQRARHAGIAPHKIQLTAQEVPRDLQALVKEGLRFNASSLRQLALFGRLFPGRQVSIRINPGLGSGHSRRTNVGGPTSSFGIWHEHLAHVHRIQKTHDLQITRLHSHVGSGADPATWQQCAALTLRLARHLPQVHTVNLGGGFKVARMPGDAGTNLEAVGQAIAGQFRRFRDDDPHNRELHLEIEPGAYLVAQAGALVTTVVDVKETGLQGFRFIVVDGGMNDLLRPGLYGAQHPLHVVPARDENGDRPRQEYVVAGHCCESGDILTPAPGDPERLQPRRLVTPRAGDALLVDATGAYASSMSTVNYNSFPRSPELLLTPQGDVHVIRRRQTLEEMVAGERLPELGPWFRDDRAPAGKPDLEPRSTDDRAPAGKPDLEPRSTDDRAPAGKPDLEPRSTDDHAPAGKPDLEH
jgi:diaminopimelate decarboxylase